MIVLYFLICSLVCSFFLFISVNNSRTLARLTFPPQNGYSPKVSVLLPARNEEANIGRCLDSLLAQDYDNYEVIVLDDNSTDSTGKIIRSYEKRYPRVTAVTGKPLEAGWLGKPFACQKLIEHATGEYLFFTDVDTIHSKQSVRWAVTNMERLSSDFMSAYVQHRIGSVGEAILVPIVYLLTTLAIPLWLVPEKNHSLLSFAIGQLIVARKRALEAIGGFSAVKSAVVEDLALARTMKANGFKTVFLDAKDYLECRMYGSYREAWNGLTRAIFPAISGNVFLLAGLITLIALSIVFPVLFIALTIYSGGSEYLFNAAIPAGIFFTAWLVTLYDRRLPLYLVFLYPVLFANILVIAVVSCLRTGFGKGVEWKGRLVRCATGISISEEADDEESLRT
jgi:chlorobactene glucosyltransferase